MTKTLTKPIINKSRLRNEYLKWPSGENVLAYIQKKNIYNSSYKKAKKSDLQEAIKNSIMSIQFLGIQSNPL